MSIISEPLDEYAEAHTSEVSALLEELVDTTHRELEWPQMQVGRVEGTFLRMLVGAMGAERALEIGTFSGYSALCIAAGLPPSGRLVTCDIDPVATDVARRFFDRSEHGSKIELRLGSALDTLAQLAAGDARFDFVFIDADKESYVQYWDAVVPMVRAGGLIAADNTLWGGRVLDPKSQTDHGVVAFNRHVAADDRVEHVLLSVRDGIMLARKRGPA